MTMAEPESRLPRVTDLFVYPVKGCAGIRVDSAVVGRGGFCDDRRWMITDPRGRFLSQRELPELCRLLLAFAAPGTYRIEGLGGRVLEFPRRLARPEPDARPLRASVWQDEVEALEWPELSSWLSSVLRQPVRGVFVPDDALRPVDPQRARPGDRVGFADGYPFLLASEESVALLNARLAQRGCPSLDVRRFRPNLVVAGCRRPHEEDEWVTLSIGAVDFRQTKLCDRCSVTTVDPESGERGKEPLATLAEYRRWQGKVWFAVNLVHDQGHVGQPIRRGDVVRVGERRTRAETG